MQNNQSLTPASNNENSSNSGDQFVHLWDYWRIISKRWLTALLMFTFVSTVGFFITRHLPKKYTANTTLEINSEEKETAVKFYERSSFMQNQHWLKTQFQLIKSEIVLQEVINDLDLYSFFKGQQEHNLLNNICKSYGSTSKEVKAKLGFKPKKEVKLSKETKNQWAIATLQKMISTKPSRDTTLITLSVTTKESPEMAARIAREVIKKYEDFKINSKLNALNVGLKALATQYTEQKESVDKARKKVSSIRRKYNLATLPEKKIAHTNDVEVNRLKGLLAEAKVELNMKEVLYKRLTSMTKAQFEEALGIIVTDSQDYMELKNQLNQAVLDYELIQMDFGENHPKVKHAKTRMKQLRQQMTDRMEGIKGGLLAQLEESRARVTGLKLELNKMLSEYAGEYAEHVKEFNNAVHDLDMQRTLLESIHKRLQEENIQMSLPRSAVTVVERAHPPTVASSPSLLKNMAISAFLGLALGLGLCFFIEYMDTSINKVDELENLLQTQVISVVPKDISLLSTKGGNSCESSIEVYRQLNTNLTFTLKEGQKAIAILSSGAGEGKSTTTFNMASTAANLGHKVLIIDADIKRPVQHSFVNVDNKEGLTTMMKNSQESANDYIKITDIENLSILCSGKESNQVYSYLRPELLKRSIENLKNDYDYIFIDCPPVLAVNDAVIVSSVADASLLVVQYQKYPRGMITRAARTLHSTSANVNGVVFNKVDVKHDNYYSMNYYSPSYY